MSLSSNTFVIPAKAGIQTGLGAKLPWIPAFAGMTNDAGTAKGAGK